MSLIPFLTAAPAAGGGSMATSIVMIVAMIAIFYFFLIRPQKKKQKETDAMIAALKKGDKIVTIGGIYGTVVTAKEKTIVVKVDDNTKIEFTRTAISGLVNTETTTLSKEEKPATKKTTKK